MQDACEKADAWGFIHSFAHGLETYVGEGGEKLSGGQKQRLALARAIIQKPKMFLLDEATASLDNAVEKKVKKHIDGVIKDITTGCTIAIAHRLTTICDYDKIIVLTEGVIG